MLQENETKGNAPNANPQLSGSQEKKMLLPQEAHQVCALPHTYPGLQYL